MSDTIHFNTGRQYQAHGQRISAKVLDDRMVLFHVAIPLIVTAHSDDRDRLEQGGATGAGFLNQSVTMGQVFSVFSAWILLSVEDGGRYGVGGREWRRRGWPRR